MEVVGEEGVLMIVVAGLEASAAQVPEPVAAIVALEY